MQDDISAFCPMPYCYGSMRIDPVASVQHLNDPIAEAEARNLRTRHHLVYLYHVGIFPRALVAAFDGLSGVSRRKGSRFRACPGSLT